MKDIERNRDHGIPLYSEFRKLCQLPEIMDFIDLEKYILPEVGSKYSYKLTPSTRCEICHNCGFQGRLQTCTIVPYR
jgi:hypothetical protein